MSRLPIHTIIDTWKACSQNYSETARQLGIYRRTVKRWVDRGRQPWGLCALAGGPGAVHGAEASSMGAELGLEHFYIHKSSPNDNAVIAVIERSFRTDEEECFFWLEEAPRDHGELNEWYQAYLVKYNTI